MAIELGTAYISVVPETNKLAAGITGQLRQAESGATGVGRGIGNKLTGGFKAAAVGLTVAGGAALVAAGAGAVIGLRSAVSEASSLGESINAVNVVFGDASKGVLQLSKDAATAVGLSQTEFNGLAVRFSSFATTIAGEGGNVTATLDDLTTRAADFASVMNLDVAEAAQLFQSGLAGESEPLRQYGIDLSAAAVEAFAAANGIGTLGAELTEAEKVQARYGLVMQETSVAQGDFAATSDSLANRQRILGAQFDDIKARIGEAFLPAIESAFGYIQDTAVPAIEGMVTEFENGQGPIYNMSETFKNDVYPQLVAFRDFVANEVIPRVTDFATYVRDDVIPQLRSLRDWFREEVQPRLKELADYLATTFTPTWQALVDLYEEKLKPGIDKITEAFERNEPELRKVWDVLGLVAGAVFYLYTQYLSYLYPILITVAGYLIDTVVVAFETLSDAQAAMVNVIEDLYDGFKTAKDNVTEFVDKLKDVTIPGWVDKLADNMERVKSALGSSASNVKSFFGGIGDAPASFTGTRIGGGGGLGGGRQPQGYSGTALNRVRQILPSGLRVTSTYRNPARNRAVGGSPTSLHMDRSNPAVDIGGPTGMLDQFAAQLRAVGGWRQLLWRVAGHYDHIHVAHSGGMVESSWGTMPGLRSDERPAILQVGERVLSRAEVGAGGGGSSRSYTFKSDGTEWAEQLIRKAKRAEREEMALEAWVGVG